MQVTLGEDGSPSFPASIDGAARPRLRLREGKRGLEREREVWPRLRLPPLPRRRRANPGVGSFSALPGLEETMEILEGRGGGGPI